MGSVSGKLSKLSNVFEIFKKNQYFQNFKNFPKFPTKNSFKILLIKTFLKLKKANKF